MTERASAREKILGLPSYDPAQYGKIDLNRLTVYTVSCLEKLGIAPTIENIAVANYRMFPTRFAMVGFPEFPDLSRVNRALLQLRPKYRNWATGNTRSGWALTSPGAMEARSVARKLGVAGERNIAVQDEAESHGASKRTIDSQAIRARIRSTAAFVKARNDWSSVTGLDILDLLEVYAHTPPKVMRQKLEENKTFARDSKDAELEQFLVDIGKRFSTLFHDR